MRKRTYKQYRIWMATEISKLFLDDLDTSGINVLVKPINKKTLLMSRGKFYKTHTTGLPNLIFYIDPIKKTGFFEINKNGVKKLTVSGLKTELDNFLKV